MKLLVLSDLHLECHQDGGASFISQLRTDVDGVILAGDICTFSLMESVLSQFCARYSRVFYVLGNHEYWGSSFAVVQSIVYALAMVHPQLHVLENSITEVSGIRFLGTTLWFPETEVTRKSPWWSDYRRIYEDLDNTPRTIALKNVAAVEFLNKNLKEGDVVITHHLPCQESIHPYYATEESNVFFLTDLGFLIQERKPQLWVHGHSHEHADHVLGVTRVLANPFGYPFERKRTTEDLNLVVEVNSKLGS